MNEKYIPAEVETAAHVAWKAADAYREKQLGFNARVDAHNKASRDLEERTGVINEDIYVWKSNCAGKPFDEADEAAVKKELAAEAAATAAAASASAPAAEKK